MPYNTSWYLLHRIRHAMAERDSQYTLAGIVELGDTFFGAPRKGGKRGRGTTKTKAIVALSINEVGSLQFAKMQVVPDLKGTTIGKFAKENIVAGSEAFTDAYLAYRKPLSVKYWHNYAVFDADSDMLRWLHTIIGNSKSFVLENDVLHADETTLQVLHEEGKTPQSKSYMWLYRTSGDTKQAIVLYEYQPDRKAERPKKFLKGFHGYLHTDGYSGYHSLPEEIMVVGCWAHYPRCKIRHT